MEIGIFIALILTILILLFIGIRQHRAFRKKEEFHETQMQQMARSFAAERRAFIEKEKNLKRTFHKEEIKIRYRTSPPDLFADNRYWRALSFWMRKEKQWRCEKCGINLEKRQSDLHVHHILGRGFNSPQHLEVLCIACHAEEPGHAFMKTFPEYEAFLKWKTTT